MKEELNYRDNLAKNLKSIRNIDADLAQEHKEKISQTEEYKSERTEKINRMRYNKALEKNAKEVAQILKLRDEIMKTTEDDSGHESNEQIEQSPEVMLYDRFDEIASDLEGKRDIKRISEVKNSLERVLSFLKKEYKKVHEQGLTLDQFYAQYGVDYMLDRDDSLGKFEKNTKKFLKLSEKDKSKFRNKHGNNSKPFEFNVRLAGEGKGTGYELRQFLNMFTLPIRKKVAFNERNNTSQNDQFVIAKKFGLVENDYNGPLMQHQNFGAEANIDRTKGYDYDNLKTTDIPGAKIYVKQSKHFGAKGFNQYGAKTWSREYKSMSLRLGREFFDKVLEQSVKG